MYVRDQEPNHDSQRRKDHGGVVDETTISKDEAVAKIYTVDR